MFFIQQRNRTAQMPTELPTVKRKKLSGNSRNSDSFTEFALIWAKVFDCKSEKAETVKNVIFLQLFLFFILDFNSLQTGTHCSTFQKKFFNHGFVKVCRMWLCIILLKNVWTFPDDIWSKRQNMVPQHLQYT